MTFSPLDSALLGPLFTTDAMRACFSDAATLAAMVAAEAALARAEAGLGLAPSSLAASIEAAGATLDAAEIGAATALAGVPTIPFVAAMQERLPPDLATAFHRGATTQDIMDTALVLRLRSAFALIAAELDAILAGLAVMATTHRATPCVGRTYGQHAAPLTFGFKAAIWLSGIAEATAALPALRADVLVASLGGPVGILAALGQHGPAVLDAFAHNLGLRAPPLAWHTLRGRMVRTGAWLVQLLGALAKMATDIASLAATECGELAEPHAPGRGGSSAMPHKRNPISCIVILSAFEASRGHAASLSGALAAAHERAPGPWHAEWHTLPLLFGLAAGALREARVLAEGLVVDTARMRANIDQTGGLLFAEAAAAALAPTLGRAAAHHVLTRAADQVRAGGLQAVLPGAGGLQAVLPQDVALDAAFDLAPSIEAASPWIDRALAQADAARTALA